MLIHKKGDLLKIWNIENDEIRKIMGEELDYYKEIVGNANVKHEITFDYFGDEIDGLPIPKEYRGVGYVLTIHTRSSRSKRWIKETTKAWIFDKKIKAWVEY